MAITSLTGGSASSRTEQFAFTVDYDNQAQTVGLTCGASDPSGVVVAGGAGHGTLTVLQLDASGSVVATLGSVNTDQYGSTSGTIKQTETVISGIGQQDAGQSTGLVNYDATRHIVLGPGATGIDVHGTPLSTKKVSSAVVGLINPPKGTPPGLAIPLTWNP